MGKGTALKTKPCMKIRKTRDFDVTTYHEMVFNHIETERYYTYQRTFKS